MRTSAQASGSASARNSKKQRCFNSLSRLTQNHHHFQPHLLARKIRKISGKLGGLLDALEVGLGLFQEVDMRQQPLPHPRHLAPTGRENEFIRDTMGIVSERKGFARTAFARSDPISRAISRYALLPLSPKPTVTATK